MPKYIIGKNCKARVQKTLATAISVTTITQAAEGVVTTGSAHAYTNGDWVVMSVTSGMVELDGQIARIKAASGSVFTLEGIDTLTFSLSTGGVATVRKITAWEPFDNVKMFDIPESDPERLPAATIHGFRKTTAFGQDGELTGTVTIHSNPNQAAVALVRAATRAQTAMAFLLEMPGPNIVAGNAEWSGGRGFSIAEGQISESRISLNIKGETVFYET
jgi:hypothetical protein